MSLTKQIKLKKKDLKGLFRMYAKIDVDFSGKISMLEFFNYFCLDRTEFNRRTFLLMDEDKNGKIDFVEFVAAVFNYCTFTWQGSGNSHLFPSQSFLDVCLPVVHCRVWLEAASRVCALAFLWRLRVCLRVWS